MVVLHARYRHQAPDYLSGLKIEVTDKTGLDEELPVLLVNMTEEQEDIGMKYFY